MNHVDALAAKARDLHKKHMTIAVDFKPQYSPKFTVQDFRDLFGVTDIATEDEHWGRLIIVTPNTRRRELEAAEFYEALAAFVHDLNWHLSMHVYQAHDGQTVPMVVNAHATLDVTVELFTFEFFSRPMAMVLDPWLSILSDLFALDSTEDWNLASPEKPIIERLRDTHIVFDTDIAGFEEVWVVTRTGRSAQVEIFRPVNA